LQLAGLAWCFDIRMPGGSGLELQRELAEANRQVPIIFITAHADVPMTVQADERRRHIVPDETVP
jgi:FixJ family two-component response regulator